MPQRSLTLHSLRGRFKRPSNFCESCERSWYDTSAFGIRVIGQTSNDLLFSNGSTLHLPLPRCGQAAVPGEKGLKVSGLDDLSLVHHMDNVRSHGCGQSMGDDECGFALDRGSKIGQPLDLGPGVHAARGLVEEDDRPVAKKSAGQGDAPPLAAAQLIASFEPPS
jgi:hypothetical protein